jgi:hypothetical protein
MIWVKCVCENADPGDSTRILVAHLWPRGMRKADLPLDSRLKIEPGRGQRFRVGFRDLSSSPSLLSFSSSRQAGPPSLSLPPANDDQGESEI